MWYLLQLGVLQEDMEAFQGELILMRKVETLPILDSMGITFKGITTA